MTPRQKIAKRLLKRQPEIGRARRRQMVRAHRDHGLAPQRCLRPGERNTACGAAQCPSSSPKGLTDGDLMPLRGIHRPGAGVRAGCAKRSSTDSGKIAIKPMTVVKESEKTGATCSTSAVRWWATVSDGFALAGSKPARGWCSLRGPPPTPAAPGPVARAGSGRAVAGAAVVAFAC